MHDTKTEQLFHAALARHYDTLFMRRHSQLGLRRSWIVTSLGYFKFLTRCVACIFS